MTSRRISYIVLPLFLLLIMVAILKNSISADSNNLGKLVEAKNLELNLEGKKITITLDKYEKEKDNFIFKISKKNTVGSVTSYQLTGFESEVKLCASSFIKLQNNQGYAICFWGETGVHSKNLELVKYSAGKFSDLKINGENNIFSDVPNFDFIDRNSDGFLDLVVDSRDYDTDPITKALRSVYMNEGTAFNFDAKENITYNE